VVVVVESNMRSSTTRSSTTTNTTNRQTLFQKLISWHSKKKNKKTGKTSSEDSDEDDAAKRTKQKLRSSTGTKESDATERITSEKELVPASIATASRNCSCSGDVPYFLLDTPIVHPLALVDRRELVLGKVLGRGSFSQVLEIKGFRIQYDIDSTDLSDLDSSMQRGLRLDDSEMQRQELDQNPKLPNGQPRYVLKQLSVEALFLPEDFDSSTSDLINEASYLLRLDHRKFVCATRGFV